MSEKLIIKNFLGISDLSLDIKKVTILIGPQATGKSVCAKLLYFFKKFPSNILTIARNVGTKRDFDKFCKTQFFEIFPPKFWKAGNFFLRYELNDIFINIARDNSQSTKIKLTYSANYYQEFTRVRSVYKSIAQKTSLYSGSLDQLDLFHENIEIVVKLHLKQTFGEQMGNDQFFIPSGRSFFSFLQKSIFSFLSSNNAIDFFISRFGLLYEQMKKLPDNFDALPEEISAEINNVLWNKIKNSISLILCGQHIIEENQEFIRLRDGRKVRLDLCSSGQQEFLPLATILRYVPFMNKAFCSLYIEEPEAHLFPLSQREIVELLVMILQEPTQKIQQIIITTHSPYILTSFNNLIQAGILSKTITVNKKAELDKIISPDKHLLPDDVSAYALKNGKAESLFCEETQLIGTNVIDGVSEDLAIEFDKLLDLEVD